MFSCCVGIACIIARIVIVHQQRKRAGRVPDVNDGVPTATETGVPLADAVPIADATMVMPPALRVDMEAVPVAFAQAV